MIEFLEWLSFQLLLWSPILLAAAVYLCASSLKSAGYSLISLWSCLIISSCIAITITIGHKFSLGWVFPLVEYYLAFSLFTKWLLITFIITWPFVIFASAKNATLRNIAALCIMFGLIGLSIEIANKTYVVSRKSIAAHSWDNFFNNNGKPPQVHYSKLSKSELENIRRHVNPGHDLTFEQLKLLYNIFKNSNDSVLHDIAGNPNIDREIIEDLLKTPYRKGLTYYVGDRIARNRSTPPDILAKLLELPDDDIRAAVARNKSTSRNILINMNHPDAEKTLQELNEDKKARNLINEINKDIAQNRLDQARTRFDLMQKLHIDSPIAMIEAGKLSVILHGTSVSNRFYEQAEGWLRYSGGRFRLENCRENVIILILLGKEQDAQQLLSRLDRWYPDNKYVQRLIEDFPVLKADLSKYAILKR